MKISNYTVNTDVDDNKSIIYSTFTKKYFLYNSEEHNKIWSLLNNLNKNEYSEYDISIIRELVNKGIIFKDNVNELDILEFNENKDKYNNDTYNLMLLPTMDCNFRCTYCYEEHRDLFMDTNTADRVIKFVSSILPRVNNLRVSWFGGEPLMNLDMMKYLTVQMKQLCEAKNVGYSAMMTSNGYLITEDLISELKNLSIECIQVTVDGARDYHNKLRPHLNGEGTFDTVMNNIILLLKNDISVTFRVNVSEENQDHIAEIFDIIPENLRCKAKIDICNLYQNENKINTYELFKTAIEKGFIYTFKRKRFINCEVCKKNGLVITPDGKAIPCTSKAEKGYEFGYINENGVFILKNEELYFKLKTATATERESCQKCKRLPLCIANCKFKMIENKNGCLGQDLHAMSIEEVAKLHYYSDLAEQNNLASNN